MKENEIKYSKIVGTGSYLPKKLMTNKDFTEFLDTSEEWIETRTGIKSRYVATDDENTVTMGTNAAKIALDDAGVGKNEIDGIILCTITPNRVMPSSASEVARALEIDNDNVFVFDLSAACSGFIYALSTADSMIKSGAAKRILIVTSETSSRVLDWSDRASCILFGDGAGAVVLESSKEPGLVYHRIGSRPEFGDLLTLNNGVAYDKNDKNFNSIYMDGRNVYKYAVKQFTHLTEEAVKESNWTIDDIDLYIPHQANLRIIDYVSNKLNLPKEKIFVNLETRANTIASTITIAIDEAIKQNRLKKGNKVVSVAVGGGITFASFSLIL